MERKEQPGINDPSPVEFPSTDHSKEPAKNDPPVPNRAWTQLCNGKDIDDLTPDEKRDLYMGPYPLI